MKFNDVDANGDAKSTSSSEQQIQREGERQREKLAAGKRRGSA